MKRRWFTRVVLCSWCTGWRRFIPVTWGLILFPVSHGICDACKEKLFSENESQPNNEAQP